MKTTIIAFTLLLAAPALAQEGTPATTMTSVEVTGPGPAHTLGIGYGETPGGVRGAELEVYLGNLMLNAHLGLLFFAPEEGDSQNAFAVAVGLFYRWKVWDNVALMFGGRLDVGFVSNATTAGDDATQFNIEAPLRAQIYFAEILALHAEVGPVLGIVGDGGGVLDGWGDKGKGVWLDLPAVNVLATVGVTVYFR
jgi:hypothetical protein